MNHLKWIVLSFLLTACAGQADHLENTTLSEADRDCARKEAREYLLGRNVGSCFRDVGLDNAYVLQKVFVEELQRDLGEVVGYKTGGHSIDGAVPPNAFSNPMHAIFLTRMFMPSGSRVDPNEVAGGFLEADFCLRIGNASINTAQTDLEILSALDAFVPLIEIPNLLFYSGAPVVTGIIANMFTQWAFTGEPVLLEASVEQIEELNNLEFDVRNEKGDLVGAKNMNQLYRPIEVVRWLRDALVAKGVELKPGMLLSLGNIGLIGNLHTKGRDGTHPYAFNRYPVNYYFQKLDRPATVYVDLER